MQDVVANYLHDASDTLASSDVWPSLKLTFIKLNTPLPASAACEILFSVTGRVFVPRRGRLHRAKHSGAVYCNRSCLWRKDGRTAGGRGASVTTLTRNCVHRSSPNLVCSYLRAVGRKVLWSSACVCLSVCVCVCVSVCLSVCAHCFCPQDISRTGSWITTKFGGWEQGVNL